MRDAVRAAPDVLIVGGGIAGLAAGERLRTRGLTPLVLEAAHRVGGRMTTDRVHDFAIDTGVTLIGNRYRGMRALARRYSVPAVPVAFSLALQDRERVRSYRARRPLDLLLDPDLSVAAKLAAVRLMLAIARGGRSMLHGNSDRLVSFDRENVAAYFHGMGRGGDELLAAVLEPGLRAALGGNPRTQSCGLLMQVVRNTLGAGFWNFENGVDALPEVLARGLPVERLARVTQLRLASGGVEAEVERAGGRHTIAARAAILALPGHHVPGIFPEAPAWLREPASRTQFSKMASAHVALSRAPVCRHVGYGFVNGAGGGVGVLELEHLRAPGRCPEGKGMVSVYFVDSAAFRCLEAGDTVLQESAVEIVERTFPDVAGLAEFVHVIRWPAAIAQFPQGRFIELATLRRRLAAWDAPLDLAGDWLDGLSSESAIQTGQQAADRIAARLR